MQVLEALASGEAIMGGENPIGTMDLTTIAGGYGPMAISPCRFDYTDYTDYTDYDYTQPGFTFLTAVGREGNSKHTEPPSSCGI